MCSHAPVTVPPPVPPVPAAAEEWGWVAAGTTGLNSQPTAPLAGDASARSVRCVSAIYHPPRSCHSRYSS
jgi:hypothetical protein